jgi:hypothetical protein
VKPMRSAAICRGPARDSACPSFEKQIVFCIATLTRAWPSKGYRSARLTRVRFRSWANTPQAAPGVRPRTAGQSHSI